MKERVLRTMINLKEWHEEQKGTLRVRCVMKNVKKVVLITIYLAVAYAVLRKAYFFFLKKNSAYYAHAPGISIPDEEHQGVQSLAAYNYKRMLMLINQAQEMREIFNHQFTGCLLYTSPSPRD